MHLAAPAGVPGAELADFADVPWTLEPAGSPARSWALDVCREAGFEPRVVHETPDVVVQCSLAASGQAAAFVPGLAPAHLRGSARLLALPESRSRTVSVATRRSSAQDPAVRAVVTAIRACLLYTSPSPRD